MKTFAFSGKSDLSGAGNATEEKGAVERNPCTTRSPGPALGELSPPGAFQCRAPLLGVLRFLRFLKTSHILVLNKSSLCALLPLLAKRTLAIFFACKTEVSPESKLHRKMRGIALTGWLSWLKRCPQTPERGGRVGTHSGHVPRLHFDPLLGPAQKVTNQCFYLTSMMFLSLPLPLFVKSIKTHPWERMKK